MERSPLEELLVAVDRLDLDAVMALCAPGCRFMSTDGTQVEGREETRRLLNDFLARLRSTSHEITEQWNQADVWIAEVLASYELLNWLRLEKMPRAFVVRVGTNGIEDLRVYGAHERALGSDAAWDDFVRVGGRMMLPL